jgi:tetratricopeptide (TPR) repeat protein
MIRAVVIVCALAAVAAADPETEFRDALARATAGDPGALDALEALGAARPMTAWTDDAWSEAARFAERTGDYARARRDLEQVVAIGTDARLVERARNALVRLAVRTGAGGEWAAVAAEHDRLASQLAAGDPEPAIAALEALLRAHPGYPRATLARLAIAAGYERDGDPAAAATTLADALARAPTADDRTRARLALIRFELRRGELDDAEREIDTLVTEPKLVAELRAELATAGHRRVVRIVLAIGLALALVFAAVALRTDAGSWRAAARALARPPMEALFLAPIAIVLAVIAATGNPMVARAVRAIAIAGVAIAWISGASLELARRRGSLRARRTFSYAVVSVAAVLAAAYLVLDHDRMIDLVIETWREGPAMR